MALRFDRVFGLADETTLLESLFLLDSQTESLLDGFSVDWGGDGSSFYAVIIFFMLIFCH